ncbi:DNA-(apurinic or apyrimidinic site) lyase [Mycoplasmopsis mustelae]|uniref:DNA-(Apurinic or apyrimidinic site) lyase n=1 Tax=Mycoplasmopsis mustelae TaxID=171289 RepID=A0A4R7UDA5_9BACT|nr:bifunctional DNA-formamidopyrimidine glycosylase/DNA-(apurinic or apyrimidinic site) lyase [Mycoplasmopsis mustelae]TDV24458.1 DNA-(apurinic or apyrimidinic site) lyase [Mycoplasmopsis mustelae]
MPEYPEVTVVQRSLNKYVQNQIILKVEIKISKLIKNIDSDGFINFLVNKTIINIENFGKFLVFNLNDKSRLISHLRMSGKYYIRQQNDPLLYAYKHDCVYFWLNDIVLVYNDSRMFGSFEVIPASDQRSLFQIKHLGQLPGDTDVEALYAKLRNKTINIKKVLLDQSLVLGIGNIYADECLHLSKVYPMSRAKDITKEKLREILSNAQKVMDASIVKGGSSVHTYSAVNGISGKYQNDLLVYGQDKKMCKQCNQSQIIKVKLDFKENGRGTSFCPHCQKDVDEK